MEDANKELKEALEHDAESIVGYMAEILSESNQDPMTIRERTLFTAHTVSMMGWVVAVVPRGKR